MSFKYRNYHPSCPDQPCLNRARFTQKSFIAYRFTHYPPIASDFNPPAIVDGPKLRDKCERFALSFFDTIQNAQIKYLQLSKRINVVAKFGGYISEVRVAASDGESSAPSVPAGHIDLHEYATSQVSTSVIATQPLPNPYHISEPSTTGGENGAS